VKGTVSLSEIYQKYHEDIQFIPIYIREAHAVDGWWYYKFPPIKFIASIFAPKVHMATYDPQTIEERRKVAGECEESLEYGIRTYVDEMDDAVNTAYCGWPTRLYLIDTEGKVVYHGGLGPFDFHPRKLKKAIETFLAT
jgi:hypothetical protein